jgi:uncharacterized membrane protein (UPF0127 family)
MRNKIIFATLGICLILNVDNFCFAFAERPALNAKTVTVAIGTKTYLLEVAKTSEQKYLGLSFRLNMEKNQGMLFPFSAPDYYAFSMRGMNFPLDFIWVADNLVVDLSPNVDINVRQLVPKEKVDRVIEINTGEIAENQIKVGNRITFSKY